MDPLRFSIAARGQELAWLACYDSRMSLRTLGAALLTLSLAAPPALAHEPSQEPTASVWVLTPEQRQQLIDTLIEQKPNPGYYAAASALLPGAGQIALGEWQEPAIVWGLLLAASMGVYALCEGVVSVHPAYLGTTPYVFMNGVEIPGSASCAKPEALYNRFLWLAYLVAAGWTSWRTFDLAMQRRREIDRKLQPLGY